MTNASLYFEVEPAGDLDGRVAGRVGHGDDDVDFQLALPDLGRQEPAQVDPDLVDVGVVEDRVRPGEIDPFEKAGGVVTAGEPAGVDLAALVDEDDLSRLHGFDAAEVHEVQADGLGGEGV